MTFPNEWAIPPAHLVAMSRGQLGALRPCLLVTAQDECADVPNEEAARRLAAGGHWAARCRPHAS
jgi:hypothetical protein